MLTYIYYIREYKTFINSVKDRREFVISKGRLIIGGKGFVINRREYIIVCKRE
jgi:hypothetical protein